MSLGWVPPPQHDLGESGNGRRRVADEFDLLRDELVRLDARDVLLTAEVVDLNERVDALAAIVSDLLGGDQVA